MQLVHRLKIGNLEKERAPIRERFRRRDAHGIMTRSAVVTGRELARTIAGAVTIVPALREMILDAFDDRAIQRLSESNENAIAMDVESVRKLNRIAGVTNALGNRVRKKRGRERMALSTPRYRFLAALYVRRTRARWRA